MRRAVFLDRDGTLIEDRGYLTPASQLRVFPWAIDAVRLLKRAGYAVIVVTNQGGVARGLYSSAFVDETHRQLGEQFAAAGAAIDCWQYCPHHPEARIEELRVSCACRKPGTGMADAAAQTIGAIDLASSWVVGDYWRDVQLGHALGTRTILIARSADNTLPSWWPAHIAPPTSTCNTLIAAVARILYGEQNRDDREGQEGSRSSPTLPR